MRRTFETSKGRLAADRIARGVVSIGGFSIIGSILGILVFIVAEVLPMLSSASVDVVRRVALPGIVPAAVIGDEYRTLAAVLAADGRIRVIDTASGAVVSETELKDPAGTPLPVVGATAIAGASTFAASTSDGRVAVLPIRWSAAFRDGNRIVEADVQPTSVVVVDPSRRRLGAFTAAVADDGAQITVAAETADGVIAVVHEAAETNEMTGETTRVGWRAEARMRGPVASLVVEREQRHLFAASGRDVRWWTLGEGIAAEERVEEGGSAADVTALSLLIGDRSLVVGRGDGSVEIWFPVRHPDGGFVLTCVRGLPPLPSAIRAITPSTRVKGFLASSDGGRLALYHSTSQRRLWEGETPILPVSSLYFSPKDDGAIAAGPAGIATLHIRNPHPEVSWTALFGKVWYEGYEAPEYVWQSSSGTDDFEPKLSLVPLLVGTLKGTFYSLVLAVPLGVLAAMYASQFMHASIRRFVKPTVEIMASLPSVVLGFLAGLWLAPWLERVFPGVLLMGVALPAAALASGWIWEHLPWRWSGYLPHGTEIALHAIALIAGGGMCLAVSGPFGAAVFPDGFGSWLTRVTGLPYDQKNAVVVGIAMGFAVIPIIFSIAEEAFSNVPRNLVSGARALGASRWDTVVRVVLPSASPGIFAAIMVGFGRAVGETMIVLMATGNTPIRDWNPFNGFRTLSANIAVEIPEAPVHGTLYRTLFLAALLLFALTFVVNTAAEVVRHRLRRRYGQL